MKRPNFHSFGRAASVSRSGSTLVAALLTVTVLAIIAADVLTSVGARYNSAYRSASWNDALLAAQAGVDTTMADLLGQIPNVQATTGGLGLGYTQQALSAQTLPSLNLFKSGSLTDGTLVNLSLPAFVHNGEGGTTQQAAVALKVIPLQAALNNVSLTSLTNLPGLLNGNNLQLLQLVSTGTVNITGGTRTGPSRLDNELWRPSLLMDRLTGGALTQGPTIARQIQVILRPVYPFESAVASNGAFQASNLGTVFDSFNSVLGQYDSLKHLSHGNVCVNSPSVALGGIVYGNVTTNGGDLPKDGHVTGSVNNAAYHSLPYVSAPTWTGSPLAPSSVTGNTTLAAGTILAPMQYRLNGISGNLHITKGLLALGTNVEIYVNGDVTGGIEIDPGITAKVYVSGSIITKASQLKNDSNVASYLQIYGVPSGTMGTPQISLISDANLVASIYAPGHNVTLNGYSDFSGAITASSFSATNTLTPNGGVRVHYDEALSLNVGPLLRYQIASWKEITPN